jgi:hypothetical protein
MSKKNLQIDDSTILQYTDKKINNVEPLLEIYKGKIYCNIIRFFITECIKTFGTKIFSIKKSYQRTITNILSSWMFSLYSTYDFSGDYFFPNNYHDTSILKTILSDLCKYDTNISNKDILIDKLLNNLIAYYKNQLDILKKYNLSDLYNNNKNNFKITKNIYEQKRYNKIILFYKFIIIIKYNIRDKRLQNILDNILIPIDIYDKLISNYTGAIELVDNYIWAIIYRYQLLGSNNHQLAVLPNIMSQLNKDFNLNFECFASAINSTFNNYCSIYYDLEKYFGSVGSFFDIKPIKGTFGFNPPYQTDIITNGLMRILELLDNVSNKLTFIITIPIWDAKGKKIMLEKYNNEKYASIDYGEFKIIDTIIESKYFKEHKMISKEQFTYIDHNFMLFKNKTIQNTYVIIMSNTTISKTIENYDFFTNT